MQADGLKDRRHREREGTDEYLDPVIQVVPSFLRATESQEMTRAKLSFSDG